MPNSVRRMLLFAPPALLSIVNFRHPILTAPIYRSVSPHLAWWSTLHLLNLGLFALLGLAVYLLLDGVHNAAANLSRVALAVFIPLYCAFDALAGLGTGLLAHLASQLPSNQTGVAESLIDRYWSSGTINGLAVAGSIAWVVALLSAAVAATAPERRRLAAIATVLIFVAGGWARTHLFTGAGGMSATPAWWLTTLAAGVVMLVIAKPGVVTALLTLAALLFGAAHVPPTGPLGALCFLAAAVLLDLGLVSPLAGRSSEGHPSRLEAPA